MAKNERLGWSGVSHGQETYKEAADPHLDPEQMLSAREEGTLDEPEIKLETEADGGPLQRREPPDPTATAEFKERLAKAGPQVDPDTMTIFGVDREKARIGEEKKRRGRRQSGEEGREFKKAA